MKPIRIVLTLLLITLAISCSKIDNYNGPNAGITGIVTDTTTNSGIQSEEPNGYQIRLLEFGYNPVIPLDFWGKADGSFKNTQLFADKYKVIPINGPFLTPDTVVVTLSGLTTVNFTVTPFMTVTASTPQVVANNVIVKYTLSKPALINDNIITSMTLAAKVPAVSVPVNTYNVSHDLSGMTYSDIVATQFSDTLKNLPSGTFYVRVGARTDNAQNKYNYSQIYIVVIP
jgi:hypothetical protein